MKNVALIFLATLLVLGLLPFALIAKSRASQKDALPVHLVMDMDKQPRGKPQRATPMFADDRFMRPQVEHTIAMEDLLLQGPTLDDVLGTHPISLKGGTTVLMSDPATYEAVTQGRIRPAGMSDEAFKAMVPPNKNETEIQVDSTFYVRRIPGVFPVTADFLKRGQERFNIYCAPCHGESGYGDGMVAQHADTLMHTADAVNGWTKPQNLNEEKIQKRPDGQIFNTITYGVRNMPAYDKQIAIEDRWAIIAYVRALQHSQNAAAPAAP